MNDSDSSSLHGAARRNRRRNPKYAHHMTIGETVKNYKILSKLGEGGFGVVYLVEEKDSKCQYAMKTESLATKWVRESKGATMAMEITVLRALEQIGCKHSVRVFDADKGGDSSFIYMVMSLIGPTLTTYRKGMVGADGKPCNRFTLATVIRTSLQCLEAIANLHYAGYLHRDLKPPNFTSGRKEDGEQRLIYLIDFGMARKFTDFRGQIRTPRQNQGFKGTVRYAPKCCHDKEDHSTAADLESWFYQMVEFTAGHLPWKDDIKMESIAKKKNKVRVVMSPERTDMLKACPKEFDIIFSYICSLDYYDTPDYESIKTSLKKCLMRTCPKTRPEDPYDWETNRFNPNLGIGPLTRLSVVGLSGDPSSRKPGAQSFLDIGRKQREKHQGRQSGGGGHKHVHRQQHAHTHTHNTRTARKHTHHHQSSHGGTRRARNDLYA